MPDLRSAKLVYQLPAALYCFGASVRINEGQLLARGGLLYCRLTLQVVDQPCVRAVTVGIQALDAQGAPLGLELPYRYRTKAGRNAVFGQKEAILLPLSDAAAFDVRVLRADFERGEPWLCSERWSPLPAQPTLEAYYGDPELAEQFRIRYGRDCRYRLTAAEDLWMCTCGAVNRAREASCHRCRRVREALERVNTASLRSESDRRVQVEPLRAKATKEEKRALLKKLLLFAAVVLPLLILVIGLLVAVPKQLERKNLYEAGQRLAGEGEYEQAREAFASLGDYRDSREMAEKGLDYLRAGELALHAAQDDDSALQSIGRTRSDLDENNTAAILLYEAAEQAFRALGDYRDSPEQAAACAEAVAARREAIRRAAFENADALLESGQYSAARAAYLALGAQEEAQEPVYRKAAALVSYIEHTNIQGVFASLSMDEGGRSIFSMSKDKALNLGSQSVADLLACCGEDAVDLQFADEAPEGLLPLDQAVLALLGEIEGYRDTDAFPGVIAEATDYTRAFFTLCENGDLPGAYEWLQSYEGEFENREQWLEDLALYLPWCGEWDLYLGDATVIPLTLGRDGKCMSLRSRVLLKDGAAVLRLSDAGGEFSVDLFAEQGSTRFTNEEEEKVLYLAVINNYGHLSYFKYRYGGILVSSCEYDPAE